VADLSYPVSLRIPLAIAGELASRFTVAQLAPQHLRSLRDFRLVSDTHGTISHNNRVMVRPSPTEPEQPFAGARVRLHRLADGYLAWQGQSDANGYYWPTGLEIGVEYVPVAIDLERQFECIAAGPVAATERV
jgi:hypothetical protein